MSEIKLDQVTFEEDISQITSTNQAGEIEDLSSPDTVSNIVANTSAQASFSMCRSISCYFMEGIQEMVGLDKAAADALTSSDAGVAINFSNTTEV